MTTKELDVIEAEIIPLAEPLSEGRAKVLDKRIRQAGTRWLAETDTLEKLIREAAAGQIWVALGKPSLSAYLKEAVQIVPKDKAQRQALAESLAGKGFSNRTTAAMLGVTEGTIRNDLEGAQNSAPVEGADGKTYTKPKPKKEKPLVVEEVPIAQEPATKVPPVSQDFRDEMEMLQNSVASFKDIIEDERFAKAAKTIAKRHQNDLQDAIKDLQGVVDALMG